MEYSVISYGHCPGVAVFRDLPGSGDAGDKLPVLVAAYHVAVEIHVIIVAVSAVQLGEPAAPAADHDHHFARVDGYLLSGGGRLSGGSGRRRALGGNRGLRG